MEEMIYRKAKS